MMRSIVTILVSALVVFSCIRVADAETEWFNLTIAPSDELSTFDVLISGAERLNPLYRSAIRRAFTSASENWLVKGGESLKAKVRFKDLGRGVISRHKFEKDADVVVELSNGREVKWHVYREAPLSNTYDLHTAILREIYNCLIFHGSFRADPDGSGGWVRGGTASRFDKFVVNGNNCPVFELDKPQLGKALTSELYFLIPSGTSTSSSTVERVRLYTPSKFTRSTEATASTPTSVYHLACTDTSVDCSKTMSNLMQPILVKGKQCHVVSDVILRMQAAYLNTSLKGAPSCTASTRDGTSNGDSGSEVANQVNKVKRVMGLPLWAFGLCVVGIVILIFILLWLLCTTGAKAKQREGPSCFKSSIFSSCCTGILDYEDERGRERERNSFYYVGSGTLDRMSFNTLDRRSLDSLRRSGDMWPAPIPPEPVAASETVLPGYLQTRIPSNMGKL